MEKARTGGGGKKDEEKVYQCLLQTFPFAYALKEDKTEACSKTGSGLYESEILMTWGSLGSR